MVSGATYYIVVTGFGSASGAFQLNLTAIDGSTISSLPVRGNYAAAQAGSFAPALANGNASGAMPRG